MESIKLWGGRILTLLLVLAVCFLIYQHFQKPTVVSAPHYQVITPSGLIKVALDNKFHISKYQAESFSEQIKESEGKAPEVIIPAKGSTWEKMSKDYAAKVKADFAIVTDPKNPNQKPNPPKDSTVNLNQYNLFAYPKTQAVIAYSPGTEVILSYQWKIIKAKGFQGYIGPYGRVDLNDGQRSSLGVMIILAGTK